MKTKLFIPRLLILFVSLVLLTIYVASSFESAVVKAIIYGLFSIIMLMLLYIEINKQMIYYASHALLEENDKNTFKKYYSHSNSLDPLKLMEHSRSLLNAFDYIDSKRYNEALNILNESKDIFAKDSAQELDYLYLLAIVSYKSQKTKYFVQFYTQIKSKENVKGNILNTDYLEALFIKATNKNEDTKELFKKAYDQEKNIIIKKMIQEEM